MDTQIEQPTNTNDKPVWSKRLGYVEVSIWPKQINNSIVYSVSTGRSYKDKEGNWKRTNNLDSGDVGNLITLLQKAQAWIVDRS